MLNWKHYYELLSLHRVSPSSLWILDVCRAMLEVTVCDVVTQPHRDIVRDQQCGRVGPGRVCGAHASLGGSQAPPGTHMRAPVPGCLVPCRAWTWSGVCCCAVNPRTYRRPAKLEHQVPLAASPHGLTSVWSWVVRPFGLRALSPS